MCLRFLGCQYICARLRLAFISCCPRVRVAVDKHIVETMCLSIAHEFVKCEIWRQTASACHVCMSKFARAYIYVCKRGVCTSLHVFAPYMPFTIRVCISAWCVRKCACMNGSMHATCVYLWMACMHARMCIHEWHACMPICASWMACMHARMCMYMCVITYAYVCMCIYVNGRRTNAVCSDYFWASHSVTLSE